GLWLKGQVQLGRKIDEHVAVAAQKIGDAEQLQRAADVLREQALELFDGAEAVAAESLWEQYGGDMAGIDASLGQAGSALEAALVLDASREDVRARLAEVLFKRMLVVEEMHEPRRLDEMQARLELYDVEGALWSR